jgi:hypothetical protein
VTFSTAVSFGVPSLRSSAATGDIAPERMSMAQQLSIWASARLLVSVSSSSLPDGAATIRKTPLHSCSSRT